TPQLKRITKYRRKTSTMVALMITGKIYKRHFDGSINAEKLTVGLLSPYRAWSYSSLVNINNDNYYQHH
ncbi:MAG: hypothetical protein QGM50_04670, partial [Anaerolineae bacterium]|nr:hypothetical protein [Anaerolineae bacterium]